MEKIPVSARNPQESAPEKILTSGEIDTALSQFAEDFTPGRELSDEKGVYLKEVEVQGEKEGEVTQYQYMRKGNHSNQNASLETAIRVVYYMDGIPVGGNTVAKLDEATGEWRRV